MSGLIGGAKKRSWICCGVLAGYGSLMSIPTGIEGDVNADVPAVEAFLPAASSGS